MNRPERLQTATPVSIVPVRSRRCTRLGGYIEQNQERQQTSPSSFINRPRFIGTPVTEVSSQSHTTGYTLPGETNIVILEWHDDQIMSPSRPGNNIPSEVYEPAAQYRPLLESQHIEFYEMIDPSSIED